MLHGNELPDRGRMLLFVDVGGAKPIADSRGGVDSAPLKARAAASDGQYAFTRAARSAGLRFAVSSLSGASDRETTKSGACLGTSSTASRPPSPEKEWRVESEEWR